MVNNNKKLKVKDPPRYPNIINGYESIAKKNLRSAVGKSIAEVTKEMVMVKIKK
jgi:hypothetical protein